MPRVHKVEQAPVGRERVGLADLEERLVVARLVRVGERELVDGVLDARVGDGPAQVASGLAADDGVGRGGVGGGVGRGGGGAAGTFAAGGRKELGDAEVTGVGWCEEVVLGVE